MNESYLKGILAEICEEEIAELNKFPPFKPSMRHRFAMKRIFSLFKNNTRKTKSEVPKSSLPLQHNSLRLSKRLIILIAVIICAALLTGFMLVYFSKNFHGTVYNDNTQLFAINTENCPITIEYEYYLSNLPDGFEMVEHNSSSYDVYILYENNSSDQVITLTQYTKSGFNTHYNTEYYNFEEIEINDYNGVCLDFSNDERDSSIVIWDDGEYILEISGNIAKKELLGLAKSAKVLEN